MIDWEQIYELARRASSTRPCMRTLTVLACLSPFLGEKIKRTQRDSNPRPSIPKTDALSTELWVHRYDYITPVNDALSAELRVPIVMPQKVYPGKKVVLY